MVQPSCFNPACRKTDFNVPGGTPRPSLPPPGIVTTPFFVGWRKCRWLPVVRTCCHPSFSIIPMRSRYFNGLFRSRFQSLASALLASLSFSAIELRDLNGPLRPLLKLLNLEFGLGEDVAALFDQGHALLVFVDGLLQPDRAALDLLGDRFELLQRFLERQ